MMVFREKQLGTMWPCTRGQTISLCFRKNDFIGRYLDNVTWLRYHNRKKTLPLLSVFNMLYHYDLVNNLYALFFVFAIAIWTRRCFGWLWQVRTFFLRNQFRFIHSRIVQLKTADTSMKPVPNSIVSASSNFCLSGIC